MGVKVEEKVYCLQCSNVFSGIGYIFIFRQMENSLSSSFYLISNSNDHFWNFRAFKPLFQLYFIFSKKEVPIYRNIPKHEKNLAEKKLKFKE